MKKHLVIIFMSLISLLGCKPNVAIDVGDERAEYVKYPNFIKSNIESLFSHIEIIPVGAEIAGFDREFPTMIIEHNGSFFINDQRGAKGVIKLSETGEMLNRFGRIGRGPNEYLHISNFEISDDGEKIYLFSDVNETRYVFNSEGELLEKNKLPGNFQQAVNADNGGYWTYFSWDSVVSEYRLNKYNSNLKITHPFLKNEAVLLPMEENTPVFSRHKDKLFLRETFSNKIRVIENDTLHTAYVFDFGKYNIPQKFFEFELGSAALFFLIEHDFAIIKHFAENDNYVIIEVAVQKQDGHFIMLYAVKNKSAADWEWFEFKTGNDSFTFAGPFADRFKFLTEDGYMIFLAEPDHIMEASDDFRKLVSDQELMNRISDKDNSYIIRCKLK